MPWEITGNSGTSGTQHFLGTTDAQAFSIRVNGKRALRFEAATTPNLIGGFESNQAGPGVVGAAIGGGGANGSPNRVEASFGTVGGGLDNRISGERATVGGGASNHAAGTAAMVAGGEDNLASGDYSFAAGRRAKANHAGAFVWADDQNANFASTADNQFLIRAAGGVGIGTPSPNEMMDVNGRIKADALTMGAWPSDSSYMFVGVNTLDQLQNANYALLQRATGVAPGETLLNSPVAITFLIGNVEKMQLDPQGQLVCKGSISGGETNTGWTLGAGAWGPDNWMRLTTSPRGNVYHDLAVGQLYTDGDLFAQRSISGRETSTGWTLGAGAWGPDNWLRLTTSPRGNVYHDFAVGQLYVDGDLFAQRSVSGRETTSGWTLGAGVWGPDNWLRVTTAPRGDTYHDFAVGKLWAAGAYRFDLAEVTPVTDGEQLEVGDVVIIDHEDGLSVRRSTKANDCAVYGIVSSYDQAAMVIGGGDPHEVGLATDKLPIALIGRVRAKVSAENGPIEVGDLLTTSGTPGHLMKCKAGASALGTIAGKALEPLRAGLGISMVLVTLL